MKKTRIGGLDEFLQSTHSNSQKQTDKEQESRKELAVVKFQLSDQLKKKISKHCIDQDITIREFLTELIEQYFKQ